MRRPLNKCGILIKQIGGIPLLKYVFVIMKIYVEYVSKNIKMSVNTHFCVSIIISLWFCVNFRVRASKSWILEDIASIYLQVNSTFHVFSKDFIVLHIMYLQIQSSWQQSWWWSIKVCLEYSIIPIRRGTAMCP